MFYSKYRPQKFSEMVKPNEISDALATQIVKGKLSHAYIFVGSRGTGKTSMARILAKALNCLQIEDNGDPCDECTSCVAIKNGSFPDLIEIDAASNRGIDDIRELKSKVKLAPSTGKVKVYIIDEVHMLTTEAFNALLKTLEEPPSKTTFILCTTEYSKVPDTIKSRCQVFKFKRATLSQLVSKLKIITQSESITVSDADLKLIAKSSLGGFRDAETMLQQASEGGISVESMLNIGSKERFVEAVDFLSKGDSRSSVDLVSRVFDDGVDIYAWTGELLRYLRDIMIILSGSVPAGFDMSEELDKQIHEQSGYLSTEWVINSLEILIEAQNKIKGSFIPQLPIEIAFIKICHGGNGNPTAQTQDKGSTKSDQLKIDTMSESAGTSDGPIDSKYNLGTIKKQRKSSVTDEEFIITDNKELEDIIVSQTGEIYTENISNQEVEEINVSEDSQNEPVVEVKIIDSPMASVTPTTMEEINKKWASCIEYISKFNNSVMGLLKTSVPVAIEGEYLVLEVYFAFHKERIESVRNRIIIEEALKNTLGKSIKIKCRLNQIKPQKLKKNETGVLTDFNLRPSEKKFDKNVVIEMLDGGLPIV